MRALTLIGLFAVLQPTLAQAQITDPSDPIVATAQPLRITPSVTSTSHRHLPPAPAGPLPCCSIKGALIGLSIGIGLGTWAGLHCDNDNCGSDRLIMIATLGGIGAGLGAIAGAPNRMNPVAFPRDGRVGVAPMLSRGSAGGAMAVRF